MEDVRGLEAHQPFGIGASERGAQGGERAGARGGNYALVARHALAVAALNRPDVAVAGRAPAGRDGAPGEGVLPHNGHGGALPLLLARLLARLPTRAGPPRSGTGCRPLPPAMSPLDTSADCPLRTHPTRRRPPRCSRWW